MINTLSQPREKAGYLDIKLPPKIRGLHWKAWRRRWVVFHPLADLADSKPMGKLSLFTNQETCQKRKPKDKVHTVYLEDVGNVLRTKSRTHAFAFAVVSENPEDTLLYLAAGSESVSQDWIATFRTTFWPDYNVDVTVDIGEVYHEVSVIDNDLSLGLGLLGRLLLVVSNTALSLYDPKDGALAHEWRMNHLIQFHLGDSKSPGDENHILVIEAGDTCPFGTGSFRLFTSDAKAVLKCIYESIQRYLNRQHTVLPSGNTASTEGVTSESRRPCYHFSRRCSETNLQTPSLMTLDQREWNRESALRTRRTSLPCELSKGIADFLAAKYNQPAFNSPEGLHPLNSILDSEAGECGLRERLYEEDERASLLDRTGTAPSQYRNLQTSVKRYLFGKQIPGSRNGSGSGTSTPPIEDFFPDDIQAEFMSNQDCSKYRTVSVSSALSASSRDSGVAVQSSEGSAVSFEDPGISRAPIPQQRRFESVDTTPSSSESGKLLKLAETLEKVHVSAVTDRDSLDTSSRQTYPDLGRSDTDEGQCCVHSAESPVGEDFDDIRPTTYSESEADDETDDETSIFHHRRRSYKRKTSSTPHYLELSQAPRVLNDQFNTYMLTHNEPPELPPRPQRQRYNSESLMLYTKQAGLQEADHRRCVSDSIFPPPGVTESSEGGRVTSESADDGTERTSSTVSRKASITSQITLTALGSQASLNKTPVDYHLGTNHLSFPVLHKRTTSNPELYTKRKSAIKQCISSVEVTLLGMAIPDIYEEDATRPRYPDEYPLQKMRAFINRPKSHSDLCGMKNEYENSIQLGHQRRQSFSSCETILVPGASKNEQIESEQVRQALRKISTNTYLDLDAVILPDGIGNTPEEDETVGLHTEPMGPPDLPPRCTRRAGVVNTDEIYEDLDRYRKNLQTFLGMPDFIHDPPPPVPIRPNTLPRVPKLRSRLGTLVRRRKHFRRRRGGRKESQEFTSEEDGQVVGHADRVRRVSAWPLGNPHESQESVKRQSLVTDNELYSFQSRDSPTLVVTPTECNEATGLVSCGSCGAVGRIGPSSPVHVNNYYQPSELVPCLFPSLVQSSTSCSPGDVEGAYLAGSESSHSDSSACDTYNISRNTFIRRPVSHSLAEHTDMSQTFAKRLSEPNTSLYPVSFPGEPPKTERQSDSANLPRRCQLRSTSLSVKPPNRTTTWYVPSTTPEIPKQTQRISVSKEEPLYTDMTGTSRQLTVLPTISPSKLEPPRYMNFMGTCVGEANVRRQNETSSAVQVDNIPFEDIYINMEEDIDTF